MFLLFCCRPSISGFKNKRDLLGLELAAYQSSNPMGKWFSGVKKFIPFEGYVKSVKTAARISFPKISSDYKDKEPSNFLSHKKMVPYSEPPSMEDVESLYEFFDRSTKLVVLTGAGMSTESGIPDYRSPNGAYSTGFKPITHQEFLRSIKARRRYWARSYAGWRRFTAAQPSTGHIALSSLEKAGHISFMITQNVDRWLACLFILSLIYEPFDTNLLLFLRGCTTELAAIHLNCMGLSTLLLVQIVVFLYLEIYFKIK